MIRVKILNGKGVETVLEVPKNITIRELDERYCNSVGGKLGMEFLFCGEILENGRKLSEYEIEDNDVILYTGGLGSHLCPYGCGRQIPDGYKGCTELLKYDPNYFG